ncbi:MAG: sugar ABC transporter permease [Chloroflexi bacterium]|nr:sugar ABC transporter permease [Chloroflexota bacterium]
MTNAVYFLAVPLLLIATYKYAPMVAALFNSTQAYNLAGQPVRFIGLDNYTRIFGDPSFTQSLQLTFLFVIIKVPLQLMLGLLIALFVMDTNRINNFVRSSLFLPTVTPMVVVGLVFSFLFDREIGIINAILSVFNIDKVSWLLEPRSAQLVVILLSVWRDAGFVMLVFLAGLQGIPTQILEAAQMDGANRWQILRRIQIPLLRRTIQFALIFVTSASFQLFAPIFVVTRGGHRAQPMCWPIAFTKPPFVSSIGAPRMPCRSSCSSSSLW